MVVWFLARVPCDVVVLKGDFGTLRGLNHSLAIGLDVFLIKMGRFVFHVMINLG